ncbi:MAG: hypothetical protein H5T79_09065 [Dietzia sp.]|nr:hypothetical protein [Dietzia sp.]
MTATADTPLTRAIPRPQPATAPAGRNREQLVSWAFLARGERAGGG